MTRVLLIAGGVLNFLFFLFHLFLGYRMHHLTQLGPGYRGPMEALNIGGALFILFFAVVSLFLQREMMQTKIGRAVLTLATVLYLSRAVEEFILFNGNLAIFATCVVTGAIYGALLVLSLQQRATTPLVHAKAA